MQRTQWVLPSVFLFAVLLVFAEVQTLAAEKTVQANMSPSPKPHILRQGTGRVQLSSAWSIVPDQNTPQMRFSVRWLRDELNKKTSINLRSKTGTKGRIIISSAGIDDLDRFFPIRKMSDSVYKKIRKQGYLLQITPGKTPSITIHAYTNAGIFYGVNTLLQMISPKGDVNAVTILDWPDQQWRGIMARSFTPQVALELYKQNKESNLVFTQANKDKIDQLARQKINLIFCFEYAVGTPWAHFYQRESYWKKAYQELFKYARERQMEVVPLIGSPRNWNRIRSELLEGWWIQNEPFTFAKNNIAVADLPSVNLIKNGDFETDALGENIPSGWKVINAQGRFRLVKGSDGNKTTVAQLTMPPQMSHGKAEVSEQFNGRPVMQYTLNLRNLPAGSIYFLSTRIRGKFKTKKVGTTKAYMAVKLFDEQGTELGVSYNGLRKDTNGWKRFNMVLRVDKPRAKIKIQFFPWKGVTGSIWIDDVQCLRVNGLLRNIIRKKNTDIVVRSMNGKVTYQEGKDYKVTNGDFPHLPDSASLGKFARARATGPSLATKPFIIKRLNTGAIAKKQTVRLSYDILLSNGKNSGQAQPPCLSEESYYTEYVFPAIDRVVKNFHPRFIHFGADEVRGINRDSRCRRRNKTNAEQLGEWANKINAYLKKAEPNCQMHMWQDMISPYFNGGNPNYQRPYGGIVGRSSDVTTKNLLDNSIRVGIWKYHISSLPQMNAEVIYFAQKGFKYFSAGWRDKENISVWSQLLAGQPNALGCLDMTWGTAPDASVFNKYAADRFWNSRGRVIVFDGFDKGKPGDPTPPNWTATGRVTYSTDGKQRHGRGAGMDNKFKGSIQLQSDSALVGTTLVPVTVKARYDLTAYVKRKGTGRAGVPSLEIVWYDANRKLLKTSKNKLTNIKAAYSQQHLTALTPEGAAYLSMRLGGGNNHKAAFWFDDIFLVEDLFD